MNTLKKIFIVSIIAVIGITAQAQKYAFVDSEYILNNIPAYKSAQEQLNRQSELWQKEIEKIYQDVQALYKKYQSEEVLLTQEMKVKRQEEIIQKENSAKQLQNQYFGPDGEIYKKQEELLKPIQDEVYNAVEEIATEGSFAVIFDTSSGMSIFYSNPKYDKSDEVLQKLGYKN